ncbi:E3 ubiquitin-protein ligase SHPRH [Anopheles marshallii]|uniref:E3 ubiquitin-protein ligase SHPRH n=1 Tax=Anopheles marshallii TaxID=1521116 RepID=UPI00237C0AEF|nr:E3 ubiquitin-protein ligase SHPRH [Anopheles marshallii]
MEYCLLDIGVRKTTLVNEHIPTNALSNSSKEEPSASANLPALPHFKHERQIYNQLDPELNVYSVIRDIRRVPEYELRERTDAYDCSTVILGVFLRILDPNEPINYSCTKQRQRMIALLFEELERRSIVEEELGKTSTTPDQEGRRAHSVQQFYDQLRSYHQARSKESDSSSVLDNVQHPYLRPVLRPYQQEAISWMFRRETDPQTLPAQYVRLRNRSLAEVDFFMDLYGCTVSDTPPKPTALPAGGILADEMGMGKTVEILGLLLLNRKNDYSQAKTRSQSSDDSMTDDDDSAEVFPLKCFCTSTHRRKTITCRKCGRLQHRKCVLKHHQPKQNIPSRYICPECWRTEPLVESGATIIVSPASIKHQWESEIRKHVSDPNFRLFVYNGVTDALGKWISPTDLASYDVVLTDYNVLRPEIYMIAENARTSRHEKRFLVPTTPLTMIRWWRVCLDEAQMVEGVHSNVTKMVKALPAVHRWTVTGTPIEKTVDNLYGLVHYLDYDPYSCWPVWSQYSTRFQSGNAEPLLTMMVRVMWRTCKHAVLDQLNIPPQTERIHHIRMSDLQSYFYRGEHIQCAHAFRDKARKIGLSLRMGQMNIHTLNLLLEPLRKLRMDCTMPSVLYSGTTLNAKKLLTPAELHEHLVTANVHNCKGQLRSVVSSLNGMAAVHILQHGYSQAFRLYQASLRWADDYQGTISVDTLLQIHAIHNLLDLSRWYENSLDSELKPTAQQLHDYEERCARLEWRYIEQYASKVRTIETALRPAIQKVNELIASQNNQPVLVRLDGAWWHDLLTGFEMDDTSRHATLEHRLFREQNLLENTGVRSWRSMDLWLMNWLDKIVERRRNLKKGFQSLAFFVDNLQPNHLWSEQTRTAIEELVRTAYACHLDPALFEEDENGMRTEERRVAAGKSDAPVCLLCKVKDTLNQMEAVLFLIKQTQAATGGLWQVSAQELVLKQLHQYAKRQEAYEQTVTEGDHFLSFLERIKLEFKEYSQYWVEINYTVAAYDELTMCKSRLQLLTAAEYQEMERTKKKRTLMQLLACELPDTMAELKLSKATAEREFIRLKGTLKYLDHLGARKEIDPCPICQIIPMGKYTVLQCGHHLCSVCSLKMIKLAKMSGNVTTCVICRHAQQVKDMQYVTMTENKNVQIVRGSFSDKIVKIVETVLELIDAEADVKIVIFSHWEPILNELGVALGKNDIKYRQKSAKFYQSVAEFKDYALGITCLLLPLRYGSKGLNLTEATHVFLVEPILNPGEEMQAIGRVHRIGQTRPTFVHRFIMLETIEATIHETIQGDRSGRWLSKDVTVEQLEQLFRLDDANSDVIVL